MPLRATTPIQSAAQGAPIRRADVIRDDLESAYHRAYDEWEFVTGLAAEKPELRQDRIWQGLEAFLANRADNAFQDLEDYNNPLEGL